MLVEILLNETKKVSATREAPEFWDSDYDDNEIYRIEIRSLEDTKENLNDVIVRLNASRKIHMGLRIKII